MKRALLILALLPACGQPGDQPAASDLAPPIATIRIRPRIDYPWPMERFPEQLNDCVVTSPTGEFPRFFAERVIASAVTERAAGLFPSLRTGVCTSMLSLDVQPGRSHATFLIEGTLLEGANRPPARCTFTAHVVTGSSNDEVIESTELFRGSCAVQ